MNINTRPARPAQAENARPLKAVKDLTPEEKLKLGKELASIFAGSLECALLNPDIEITKFTKDQGPLTKRISLKDGKPASDGRDCRMTHGRMERLCLSSWRDFGPMIEMTPSNVAYALGSLRDDIPDSVPLITKKEARAGARKGYARLAENIGYSNAPSLMLLDFDTKGMPADVRDQFDKLGGFVGALESLCPGIAHAGYIRRLSTSAGLYNTATGERYPKSGEHVYLLVKDGADTERFLRTLHDRAWYNGFGWYMVNAAGQLMQRSIVDRVVYNAERLVFEAKPELEKPLAQDVRPAEVHDGAPLDTVAACLALSEAERLELERRQARARQALSGEAAEVSAAFKKAKIAEAVKRGVDPEAARRCAEQWAVGVLRPDVVLVFSDPSIGSVSVGDVLLNPERFIDEICDDPIEQPPTDPPRAKVNRRGDGFELFSWMHGGATYKLRHDRASLEQAIRAAPPADAPTRLCRLASYADLNEIEVDGLIEVVKQLSGASKTSLRKMLGNEDKEQKKKARAQQKEKMARGPLPMIRLEPGNLPRIIDRIEAALIGSQRGLYSRVGKIVRIAEDKFKRTDGTETTILIIKEVCEYDLLNETAACAHYERKNFEGEWEPADPTLTLVRTLQGRGERLGFPRLSGVMATPLLLRDGRLIDEAGYDERSGLYFNPVGTAFPKIADTPTRADAQEALETLDGLLVGFPFVDGPSRSVALSALLTGVSRRATATALAHFFTAPEAGTGKSYLIDLVSLLATGRAAPVIAAGGDDTELEKRLDGLLLDGSAIIAVDNIIRPIECVKLNQIMTQEKVKIRKLGSNTDMPEITTGVTVLANGNNVVITGDLKRRSLLCEMDAKVERPETREFKVKPAELVKENRGKYVAAALTIMRAYMVANDKVTATPIAGFEEWCAMVRDPLIWLERDDPCKTQETIRARDSALDARKALAEVWWQTYGDNPKTAAQVIGDATEREPRPAGVPDGERGALVRPYLYGVLAEVASGRGGIDGRRLGNWLGREKGRVVDSLRFEEAGKSHKVGCWKLVRVERPDEPF